MKNVNKGNLLIVGLLLIIFDGCKVPEVLKVNNPNVNYLYNNSNNADTNSIANLHWKDYFNDNYLISYIDTALKNNQELNIISQEIFISKNEIKARKGEYLPFVNIQAGAGFEKVGKYTRNGAVEEQLDIKEGKKFPTPLTDFMGGAVATWELDIWKKLHNAKDAAVNRYLSNIEGRNFAVTQLIAEIAETYFELVVLDNYLDILDKNIEIQSNALRIIKQQKDAAKLTQLAVNRFEAQLLNTQNLQFQIKQNIVQAENKIKFLIGGYSKPILRNDNLIDSLDVLKFNTGIASQLLQNRPDIRKAELDIKAAKLDVQVARANFYPRVAITAGVGLNAFNPIYFVEPASAIYNLAGDLAAPLINRNALKANYANAGAKQIQAVYKYEQTVLNAFLDVQNQLAKMDNYSKSYNTKKNEVAILNSSIGIANNLFNYARADYVEVLLTQREALDAKLDLLEIQLKLLNTKVNIYRALGGGWQ